jgi:mannose-6-phosphate isomerase
VAEGRPALDRLRRLVPRILAYEWGSRTALAELQGRPSPAEGPEAELWMGAHASAPSDVETEAGRVSLVEWVRRDPEAVLGAGVARRFGGELPFLFKVLAVERALSIQTHPDAARARAGFLRENAAGLAADDPKRSYRDANAKPELLCALTRFEALCGFRPAARIAEALEALAALGAPSLAPLIVALAAAPEEVALERCMAELLRARGGEEGRRRAREAARAAQRGSGERADFAKVAWLAAQHPDDAAVLAPLLLDTVELRAGEAIFLGPGEIHVYLGGVAVELMANSDNVLRGGLTGKHVDVPELLATLRFRAGPPALVGRRAGAAGEVLYETPAREFRLSVLELSPGRAYTSPERRSVEILLCTRGSAQVRDAARGEDLTLRRGEALLVPAALSAYAAEGDATLHRAGVPL